jgi:hypothetical protein
VDPSTHRPIRSETTLESQISGTGVQTDPTDVGRRARFRARGNNRYAGVFADFLDLFVELTLMMMMRAEGLEPPRLVATRT